MTLAEFLLARIAEDEALARKTQSVDQFWIRDASQRVLRECEAKRRIVERHAVRIEEDWVNPMDAPAYQVNEHYCEICGWVPDACDTVKDLAAVYADHPDYRDEWRP